MPGLYGDLRNADLLNGGFELWSGGSGAFTASGAVTADGWYQTIGASSTLSTSKDTTNHDSATGGLACAALTYTHSAASVYYQNHWPPLGHSANRTMSFKIRVKTSTNLAVRPYVSTDGGTTKTYGSYHDNVNAYEDLKVEGFSVPAGVTQVQVGLELNASATVYVDNAVLNYGSAAADHLPAGLSGLILPTIAQVPLVAADAAGGIIAWQNPENGPICVYRLMVDLTTKATAACTADFGTTAVSAGTSANNLITGVDLNAATGLFDNLQNAGASGKQLQRLAAGKWVTGSKASGATAGLVGFAYVCYFRLGV